MGKAQSSAVLKEAQQRFNRTELLILQKTFQNLASRSRDGKFIDKATFLRVFHLPGLLGEQLFANFDLDKNGLIDWKEFVIGLAYFARGDVEEKILFLFKMYDFKADGCIFPRDLRVMLHSVVSAAESIRDAGGEEAPSSVKAHVLEQRVNALVKSAFRGAEKVEDAGKLVPALTFKGFCSWAAKHPEIFDVISRAFNPKETAVQSPGGHQFKFTRPNSLMVTPRQTFTDVLSPRSAGPVDGGRSRLVKKRSSDRSPLLDTIPIQDLRRLSVQLEGTPKSEHSRSQPVSPRLHLSVPDRFSRDRSGSISEEEGDYVMERSQVDVTDPDAVHKECMNCGWSITVVHCYKCGKKLVPNGAGGPRCARCGPLFVSRLQFCVVCGFDLNLDRVEPPLHKDEQWDKHIVSLDRVVKTEGWLFKVGQRMKRIKKRWYEIHSNFVYQFRRREDVKPTNVIFLEGCFVERVNHEKKHKKLQWGLELVIADKRMSESEARKQRRQEAKDREEAKKMGKKPPKTRASNVETVSRFFYAETEAEREKWIHAIEVHSNVFHFENYYTLGKEIGRGSFAKVYECMRTTTGEKLAVKVIDKSKLSHEAQDALRREIAVLKMIHHPHIISLRNAFETRHKIHLVMEIYPGGELFDVLVKRKRFSEEHARVIFKQMVSAIQYLHLRGIVHRDLKPENVFLRNERDIVIGDFGFSRFATPEERMKLPCGTLSYVAPEVLQLSGYGKQVDLWSLGVILFMMLSGRMPFHGYNRNHVMERIMDGDYRMNKPVWRTISSLAKDLIQKLLVVKPNRRLPCEGALAHRWFKVPAADLPQLPPPSSEKEDEEKQK